MKLHHAAALALVGWYLMMPPRSPQGGPDLNAPMNQWLHGDAADSSKSKDDCEQFRQALILGMERSGKMTDLTRTVMEHSQCVSTDDPRLKEK